MYLRKLRPNFHGGPSRGTWRAVPLADRAKAEKRPTLRCSRLEKANRVLRRDLSACGQLTRLGRRNRTCLIAENRRRIAAAFPSNSPRAGFPSQTRIADSSSCEFICSEASRLVADGAH